MRSNFDINLFPDKADHDGKSELLKSQVYRLWLVLILESRAEKNEQKNDKIENFEKIDFFQIFRNFNNKFIKKSIKFK